MLVDAPANLVLLVLLPPVILLLILSYRRARRDLAALQGMARFTAGSPRRARTVFRAKRMADAALVTVALTCVILAAAGPRWGERLREDTRTGTELVALIDLSRSMAARDTGISRLEQGLTALRGALERLPETRVALVGFSDAPHLLLPFTDDREAVLRQLEAVGATAITLGGSDLEAALRFAAADLSGRPGAARVILLASDGEASRGFPLAAARMAGLRGVPIAVLPVGSAAGAPVPDAPGTRSDASDGAIAVSRRDDRVLRAIARMSGGTVVDPRRPETGDELATYRRPPAAGAPAAARAVRVELRARYPLLVLGALLALGGVALNRALRWRDTF